MSGGIVMVRDGRAVMTPEQALSLACPMGGCAFERDGIGVVAVLEEEPIRVIDGFGGEEPFPSPDAALEALVAEGWTSIAVPLESDR